MALERVLGFVANTQFIHLYEDSQPFKYPVPRRWSTWARRCKYFFSDVAACPFCGGARVSITSEYRKVAQPQFSGYYAHLECQDYRCKAKGPVVFEQLWNDWKNNRIQMRTPSLDATDRAIKKAIAAWNRRGK